MQQKKNGKNNIPRLYLNGWTVFQKTDREKSASCCRIEITAGGVVMSGPECPYDNAAPESNEKIFLNP